VFSKSESVQSLRCLLKERKMENKTRIKTKKNTFEHSLMLLLFSYCFLKCHFSETDHLHYKMPAVRLTVHAI